MEKLIENIAELVRIASVSGRENEIRRALDTVKGKMLFPGVNIREFCFDGASPVLLAANCDGLDFDILCVGHLDVVPAEEKLFLPQIKNGRMYARGALDMKTPVVVNLAALAYAADKNIRFGVLLTTDEETTSNGIKALVKNADIRPRIVFDTDAGDLFTLCDKAKHPVSVRLTAKGENAHSSRPWEGVNAVAHLADCIRALEQGFERYEKGSRQPENIWQDTMVVTAFNSPTTYNVVPAEAEARINFRLTEKTSLNELKARLQKACNDFGCEYEILLQSCGVYMDANRPEIAAYRKIAAETLGQELKIVQMCGGTDARMFADRAAIIMHSVNGDHAHGDNEYVDLASAEKLLEIEKKYIDAYVEGKI